MFDWFDRLAYEFSALAYDWVPFVYDWFPSLYGRTGFVIVLLGIVYVAMRLRGGDSIGFKDVRAGGKLARIKSFPQEGQLSPSPAPTDGGPTQLGELEQQILERVTAGANRLSVSGLADELEVPAGEVRTAFDDLAEKGLIRI